MIQHSLFYILPFLPPLWVTAMIPFIWAQAKLSSHLILLSFADHMYGTGSCITGAFLEQLLHKSEKLCAKECAMEIIAQEQMHYVLVMGYI